MRAKWGLRATFFFMGMAVAASYALTSIAANAQGSMIQESVGRYFPFPPTITMQ